MTEVNSMTETEYIEESDKFSDNTVALASTIGLSSGEIGDVDFDVSLAGGNVTVRFDNHDERVMYDMEELIAAAYDYLEEE